MKNNIAVVNLSICHYAPVPFNQGVDKSWTAQNFGLHLLNRIPKKGIGRDKSWTSCEPLLSAGSFDQPKAISPCRFSIENDEREANCLLRIAATTGPWYFLQCRQAWCWCPGTGRIRINARAVSSDGKDEPFLVFLAEFAHNDKSPSYPPLVVGPRYFRVFRDWSHVSGFAAVNHRHFPYLSKGGARQSSMD